MHTAAFFEGAVKPVLVVGARVRSRRAQAAVIQLAEACGMPVSACSMGSRRAQAAVIQLAEACGMIGMPVSAR